MNSAVDKVDFSRRIVQLLVNLFQMLYVQSKKKKNKKDSKDKKKKKKKHHSKDSDEETDKKKKSKEKKEERRPFDREKDLQVTRFDDAQRKSVIKRSQELGSRFGNSSMQFL